MAFLDLNEDICLDLADTIEKNKDISFFDNLNHSSRTFVRIVAKNDFICKGKAVKKGEKGAYIEARVLRLNAPEGSKELGKIYFCKPLVKIGKKSWISGSGMGTKFMESYVGRGVEVADNTFLGQNIIINDKVKIGSNCHIDGSSKIDRNSIIGDNCRFKMMTTIGPNTEIAENTTDLFSCESVKVGITPLYDKKYLRKQRYKIEKRKPIRDTNTIISKTTDNLKMLKVIAKYNLENLKDKYDSTKLTRIGSGVTIKSGARIYSGATIGNGATVGLDSRIKAGAEVNNDTINPDYSIIENKHKNILKRLHNFVDKFDKSL